MGEPARRIRSAVLDEDDLGLWAEAVKILRPRAGSPPGEERSQRVILRPFPPGQTRRAPGAECEVEWVFGTPFGILRPAGADGEGEVWAAYPLDASEDPKADAARGEKLFAWTLGQALLCLGERAEALARPDLSDGARAERVRAAWAEGKLLSSGDPGLVRALAGEEASRIGHERIARWRAEKEARRLEACSGAPSPGSASRRAI